MSRTAVNFALDVILLLITLSLVFTTAVLRFVFPAPARRPAGPCGGAATTVGRIFSSD